MLLELLPPSGTLIVGATGNMRRHFRPPSLPQHRHRRPQGLILGSTEAALAKCRIEDIGPPFPALDIIATGH